MSTSKNILFLMVLSSTISPSVIIDPLPLMQLATNGQQPTIQFPLEHQLQNIPQERGCLERIIRRFAPTLPMLPAITVPLIWAVTTYLNKPALRTVIPQS